MWNASKCPLLVSLSSMLRQPTINRHRCVTHFLREFMQLVFPFLLCHAKGICVAFQMPQDMNIPFSSTPNTDIIYGKAITISSELNPVCLQTLTVFFVFKTEPLCGLVRRGFNQHNSMYFYIRCRVSLCVTTPPMVFSELQDEMHMFPSSLRLISAQFFFFSSAVWWSSHLFLHPQTFCFFIVWLMRLSKRQCLAKWWDETRAMICLRQSHLQP